MLDLFFSYCGLNAKFKLKKKSILPQDIHLASPKVIEVLKLFHSHSSGYTLFDVAKMIKIPTEDVYLILEYLIQEGFLKRWLFGPGRITYTLEEGAHERVAEILHRKRDEKLLEDATQ